MTYLKKLLNLKYTYSIIGLLVVCILSGVMSPIFLTTDNIITIFRQASILLILASGLTVLLISGSLDLSISSTAALVGCVCGQLLKMGVGILPAILLSMILGMLVGLFNGFLVGVIKIAPFVATYGTNWLVGGLAIYVMQGQVIYGVPEAFNNLGVGYIGPIPMLVIISLAIVLILHFLLEKTTIGRNVFMIGKNPIAAKYSALNVRKTQIYMFMLCGLTAGIGGILMTARYNAAEATMGDMFGLQPVAAAVMGGTSLFGGQGGVLGTIIGALSLTIIVNIMNLIGLSTNWQGMAIGLVMIFMVALDINAKRKS